MAETFFQLGILFTIFTLSVSKRITGLIRNFSIQSFFLFLSILLRAFIHKDMNLFIIAGLVLSLKVIFIPLLLQGIVKKINVEENAGLFVNTLLSLMITLGITYFAYMFTNSVMPIHSGSESFSFATAVSVIMAGIFTMISRAKALCQVIGLMVIENGLFLSATAISGGMPFILEIAIFLDILILILILQIFVYRINGLFTHIDVNRLKNLKG
jgi:hydrogenase-4 component E